MINIKVEDNILPSSELKKLQDLMSSGLPWFPSRILTTKKHSMHDHIPKMLCSDIENWQLAHNFHTHGFGSPDNQSPFTESLAGIINHIDIDALIRIKANLNPRTESIVKHGFHKDHYKDNVKGSIFYVNTCDGYTEFEDGTRIDSVENRLVTFPSTIPHTGTTCTDSPWRIVVNFNYYSRNYD